MNINNSSNEMPNSNSNELSNNPNGTERGTGFPFDLPGWNDAPDFQFLNDGLGSPYSNAMSPMQNNQQNVKFNTSLPNNAGSPIDYTSQLQHYQNLLMETQNMLNMKQQLNTDSNQQQPQQASQQLDITNLNSRANNLLNSFDSVGTPQNQQQNHPLQNSYISSSNLLTNPLSLLQQQQLQQLAQAQLANNNKQATFFHDSPNLSSNSNTPVSGTTSSTKKKTEPPQPRTKTRPCDHCRRRKTKCLMIPELHTCKMCQSKGLKCTFNENTTTSLKRGISASNNDNAKRLKLEDIDPPPNVTIRDIPPIKDYSTMSGNSLLKKTLSLQYPRSSFYVGPTSIYDPIFLDSVILDKIDQFTLNKIDSIRKVSTDVQFTLRDDFSESLYERSERDSDTVEKYVAPHGQTLIDLYFQTVHPSFPILHKKIFLEKYARTHREFGAPLLAAVYLLAIQWWDYEPNLYQFPKPNVEALHKFALKTFADVIQRPKLSAVQAGLLLLQCNNAQRGKNWLLTSQVVALAEELGLGLDCSQWRLPKWERGLRRRLAWAVYIQDKWSSLIESRPSHIAEGVSWLVKPVSDEDFPEKSAEPSSTSVAGTDVELGKECFRHLASLSMILSEIQESLFTAKAMIEIVSVEQILTKAKPLQLKLRRWYHTLPQCIQMGTLKPRQFNSNGNLQLAYFATEMTLHRRIISAIHHVLYSSASQDHQANMKTSESPLGNTSGLGTSKNTSPSQHQNNTIPPQVVEVCRKAARTRLTAAIDFVRELKPEHLQSFWHNSSANNFALIGIFAAILYCTSTGHEEALELKEQVMDYRWILKVNSRSFNVANDALFLVDGVLKNISGLLSEQYGSPGTPRSLGGASTVKNGDNEVDDHNTNSNNSNNNNSNSAMNNFKTKPTPSKLRNQSSVGSSPQRNKVVEETAKRHNSKTTPNSSSKPSSKTGSPAHQSSFEPSEGENYSNTQASGELNGVNLNVLSQMSNLMQMGETQSNSNINGNDANTK